jgi:hypothetical protein
MKSDDILEILDECKKRFPSEYERLIAVDPPGVVAVNMLMRHTKQLLPLIRKLFANSDEYKEACRVILFDTPYDYEKFGQVGR